MKKIIITSLIFLIGFTVNAQTNLFKKHLIGTWVGTLTGSTQKKLVIVITAVTYDSKEEFGTIKGYSTVNGKNNTPFEGTFSNMGTLNMTLEEPGVNTTDGKFVIATQGVPNSYSKKVKTLIGKWISYDSALEKEVLVAKVSK